MPVLAIQRKCADRIQGAWPEFLIKRAQRLEQARRFGTVAEKVTVALLEDLFTAVLDWSLADLNHEIDYADLIVTQNGIKTLVVEAKRPGSLAWHQQAVAQALDQVRRYADAQRVPHIAITDGLLCYAADLDQGVLRDRVFVRLDQGTPPLDLWWLSVHGIYRPRPEWGDAGWRMLPHTESNDPPINPAVTDAALVHPKYRLPAWGFAYVGDAHYPRTWKLPYRLADGSVDRNRLPKAIQAILSNYRGTKVGGIPDAAIPQVLLCLAQAASVLGHMPPRAVDPAPVYQQLGIVLDTLGIPPEHWQSN